MDTVVIMNVGAERLELPETEVDGFTGRNATNYVLYTRNPEGLLTSFSDKAFHSHHRT